jgi:hypothetical protein
MNTHEYEITTDYVLCLFEQRVNTFAHISSSGSKDVQTWEDYEEFNREAAHTRRRRVREPSSKTTDEESRRGRAPKVEFTDESSSSDYYSDTPAYRVRESEERERRRRRPKKGQRSRREGMKRRKVA